jgi:hypothetical protein
MVKVVMVVAMVVMMVTVVMEAIGMMVVMVTAMVEFTVMAEYNKQYLTPLHLRPSCQKRPDSGISTIHARQMQRRRAVELQSNTQTRKHANTQRPRRI